MDGYSSLSSSGNNIATPRPINSSQREINSTSRGIDAQTSLFKNILLLQDVEFFCSILDNFCRSSSTQKITDLINSLIVILDDSFLDLLRLFIKQTIDQAKQCSTDESNPLNYQSFYNLINRMAAIYLKSQLGGLMEKTMISQVLNFTPMIQEQIVILANKEALGANNISSTNSTPTVTSLKTSGTGSPRIIMGSVFNNVNGGGNIDSLDINNSSPNMLRSNSNSTPFINGSVPLINGSNIHSPISSPTIGSSTPPTILTPTSTTPPTTTTPTTPIVSQTIIQNINIDHMKDQIAQFSISIINTIFRSVEKFPPTVFQLFEMLYLDIHQVFSADFCFELMKKIFFTKLICPILANLKSPPGIANAKFFTKTYIEVSKVVLDIAFDRDQTRRGSVTTQEQIMHFIKGMIFRNTHSTSMTSNSTNSSNQVIPPSIPLPSKDEACNNFISNIRSESSELEESFKRAKDLNTCISFAQADRHIYLFSIFKEMLINFKISISFSLSNQNNQISNINQINSNNSQSGNNSNTSSPVISSTRGNQFYTLRGSSTNSSLTNTPLTARGGGSISQGNNLNGGLSSSSNLLINPWVSSYNQNSSISSDQVQSTRVVQSFSKKWTSEELRPTYNGKSPKKRSWVLDKKNIKTQIINLHIFLDNFSVCRIVTVPMNITFQALANRIHTDSEFSDLQLNKEEYEMVIRYPEESITVLNDEGNQEVVCEPELPLWMFDIDSDSIIIFRPIKRRISSGSFNIFLKFIFPSSPSSSSSSSSSSLPSTPHQKINPMILYINPQSTPQSIIDRFSKIIPSSQLDSAHLGFYLRDIDDESSSPPSIKIPNNNPFAYNKISTMDIIECGPRLSYEFSMAVNGSTQTILIDFDNQIDNVASTFYSIYQNLLELTPRSSSSSDINGGVELTSSGRILIGNGSKHNSNSSSTSSTSSSNGPDAFLKRSSGTFDSGSNNNLSAQLNNNYSLALLSNSSFLPMFLSGQSKLQDYYFNVGDELILTEKTFVSLVEVLATPKRQPIPSSSSNQLNAFNSDIAFNSGVYNSNIYSSNYNGVSSLSLNSMNGVNEQNQQNKVIARVRVTWAGSNGSFDRSQSFINTSQNVTNNFSVSTLALNDVLSNPNQLISTPLSRPLLSTVIAQDNTYICTSKNDYCMNNQVKLCIVGEETQEKLSFYNSLRKNYSQNGLLSSGGSRGGVGGFFGSNFIQSSNNVNEVSTIDGVLHTSELVVGSAEIDQVTFKTFYISGSEQYQVVHPLFISPQSLFIITYNPLNINSTMINYWLEIIQTKAQGSSIYLVGLSTTSIDEKKFVNFKADYHRLFRFNNVNCYMNISLKNSKQIKQLFIRLQNNAMMKQFHYKIPLSYSILKSQCQESAKEAHSRNKMPLTSIPLIKNIARIFSIEPRDSEAAIKYLYEIGELLYYRYEANDQLLNELVFLDSMWMSKLISAVLALKTQNGMTVVDQISQSWSILFPHCKTNSLLFLLEKFELVYLSTEDNSVIIPQLFGGEKPSVMRDLWSPTAHANNEYLRIYEFQFLPKGFFSRLSVRVLQHYDPLCIWQNGMVLQPAGQLWGGAAKSFDSQCLIEYDSVNFVLKISIRDDNKQQQLLKSIVDLVSSFILWYFPGRLSNVRVACTHCTNQHIENPTMYTLDYLENQASLGQTSVICKAQLGGIIHETLSPRTTKTDIYSLAFEVTFNSNKFSVIPYETLKFGPQLGSGSYANVYRGIWNGSEVAIKVLNFDDGHANTTEKYREFRNEAHITGELRHANTVSLMGVSLSPFCLVTELLQYGDLAKFIRNTAETFSWGTVLKLAIDIGKGMNFLHSCKPMIVHRDLKSANILLGGSSMDNLVAKVGDFGLSIKPIGKEVKGRKVWNWRWLAPECMGDGQYTEKIDIYSYAIVLWEIITRDLPFEEYVDQLKWNSIIEDKIMKGLRPTIPPECPTDMKQLITDCWNGDPKKRPSFNSILERLTLMQKTFNLSERLEFCKQLPPMIEDQINQQNPQLPPPQSPIVQQQGVTNNQPQQVQPNHQQKLSVSNLQLNNHLSNGSNSSNQSFVSGIINHSNSGGSSGVSHSGGSSTGNNNFVIPIITAIANGGIGSGGNSGNNNNFSNRQIQNEQQKHASNGGGLPSPHFNSGGSNSGSSSVYESGDGSLSSAGSFKIIRYEMALPITFTSTIHSLYPIQTNKNEVFIWCGMGDGSVCVVNSTTRQIVSTSRCADSSRILGFSLIKKCTQSSGPLTSRSSLNLSALASGSSPYSNNSGGSSSGSLGSSYQPICPTIEEDSHIWAFYNEGILCFEAKTFKLIKTIKTNFITSLVDEGESVWTNCKEKTSCIKVISKSKLKTKKLVNVKTLDAQITTILIHHSSVGAIGASRVWLGTDRGMIFIFEYPSMTPIAHHESHGGALIHTIKRMDRYVITCSERVICVFDESGIIKKRLDGLTSRVLSLLVLDTYIIGACYDSTILVWDSKQNFRMVQSLKKKHSDAISSLAFAVSPQGKPQLWVGGWDKKITTYSFFEELESTLLVALQTPPPNSYPTLTPRVSLGNVSKSRLFG
ncbi:hypothetical protein RB653_007805 [Dictyostelium firmibasis]|uniref:Protein kinase domain-containing protein n=1 Tax=Dictyostelium firmibasis TaxID=79012 RepID=A0AAN7YPC6_9MYCE